MFDRLFTFGCSYTRYHWPTWADIVSWDLNVPLENWGINGSGNVSIFHRMVEADLRNNFTENDLLLTLWSSWTREDRYIGKWISEGNIHNCNFYDDNFIRKYWSFENDIVKNATAIVSASKMFDLKFQGHIIEIATYEHMQTKLSENEQRLFDFYKPLLPQDNVFEFTPSDFSSKIMRDGHPDILDHLTYVENKVYPALKMNLKPNTKELCVDIQNTLIKEVPKDADQYTQVNTIKDIINNKYKLKFGIDTEPAEKL